MPFFLGTEYSSKEKTRLQHLTIFIFYEYGTEFYVYRNSIDTVNAFKQMLVVNDILRHIMFLQRNY